MHRDVIETLKQIPGFADRDFDDLRCKRLSGLTNRSFKLVLNGECYVLRLAGAGSDSYIDRAREYHNASSASAIGVNPDILYFDPVSGAQLSRYVAGRSLDSRQLRDPLLLQAVVELLQRLHRCGGRFRGRMSLFPTLDNYLIQAQRVNSPYSAGLQRLRAVAEPARFVLARMPQSLCSCHIDPAPHNFLCCDPAKGAGGLYLLDWEYSAMCEPVWDLADLSIEADFDEAQDIALLRFYDGAVTPLSLNRLLIYKALLCLLGAAWGALRLAVGADATAVRDLINQRLARAAELLAEPDFGRCLATLQSSSSGV